MAGAKKPKAKGGRPRKDSQVVLGVLLGQYLAGATDEQAAAAAGVSRTTLHRWREEDPELAEVLDDAKARADGEVQQSLFRQATGTFVLKRVPKLHKDLGVVYVDEPMAPSATAGIFWLCNRQKDSWRQRVDHSLNDGRPVLVTVVEQDMDLNAAGGTA